MPNDPTPTEAETREAGQWASLQGAVDLEEKCMMRDAYAAALAKCRVDADKIRADERERCAKIALDEFLIPIEFWQGTKKELTAEFARRIAAAIRGEQ